MYIPEFVCGMIVMVLLEVVISILWDMHMKRKCKK